jgi:hypothetical protein
MAMTTDTVHSRAGLLKETNMTLSQTTRKHLIAVAITAGALVSLSAVAAEAQQVRPFTYPNPNPVVRPGLPRRPATPALGFAPCNPGNSIALFGPCVAKVGETLHLQVVQANLAPVRLQFLANTIYSTVYNVVTFVTPAGPSHFTMQVPVQLCGPNRSMPTYNVFVVPASGPRQGPIASFTPDCK